MAGNTEPLRSCHSVPATCCCNFCRPRSRHQRTIAWQRNSAKLSSSDARLDSTHVNVDNNGNDKRTQLNITDVSALQDTTLGIQPTAVLVMLSESSIRDTALATSADDDDAVQSHSSVMYRMISKGSTKMWDLLKDRAGHSYTMKPTNRPIKY